MDAHGTPDTFRPGPLSRLRFLQAAGATATATATAVAAAGAPASAASSHSVTLSLTAATGGSATLSPAGDRLVAGVQNVLWSIPRAGGTAVALTSPGLEPTRLTVVDGDPITDFDTLIRTVVVLRGGVPFERAGLVDAFDSVRRSGVSSDVTSEAEWLGVSEQMRREGCCDPGAAL